MLEGRDGSDHEAMLRQFKQTGGALESLDGITFFQTNDTSYIAVFAVREVREIGLEILQEQANWFKQYGRSQEVLEAKLRSGRD